MNIDWNQGLTDNHVTFGYISDGTGGYFFDWLDSVEEILDSVIPDVVDPPKVNRNEAVQFLKKNLSKGPYRISRLVIEKS